MCSRFFAPPFLTQKKGRYRDHKSCNRSCVVSHFFGSDLFITYFPFNIKPKRVFIGRLQNPSGTCIFREVVITDLFHDLIRKRIGVLTSCVGTLSVPVGDVSPVTCSSNHLPFVLVVEHTYKTLGIRKREKF